MVEVVREAPSEGVALLRLNRPEVLNALCLPMRACLAQRVIEAEGDPAVRVIVITGDDKAFSAGADMAELKERKVHDPGFRAAQVAWTALNDARKPLIAAINGFALGGGCELALHCDIIIAGENAKLGFPEVKIGLMPGAGGTQRLLRAAGRFQAMRWLLTGDFISAAAAREMGLVSEVVADDAVLSHALEIAAKIASRPALAVEAIKEVVDRGADASMEAALLLEHKAFQLLFATEDRNEGISAFLEKRKAVFKGR